MQSINSKKITEIVHSPSAVVDVDIQNIVTDSRQAHKTSMFVALKGEKFDGHNFAKSVIEQGCPLVMVERLLPDVPAMRQIVVPNCLEAYGRIGRFVRQGFTGKVIGLTGSSGKTTTKEEIKFLLSKFCDVYATQGNHNNFIGVPETLCNMSYSAQYAILEMGMSAKGEISKLTSYVQPDIAIVTNVFPMHIEFFENFKGIAEAKAEIFEGLRKGGTAIINADTNFADLLVRRADEKGANVVLFGSNNMPKVTPQGEGCVVQAKFGRKKVEFFLPENGEHHVYNALCALTVVDVLGLDVEKAATYLKDFGALAGRGKKHTLRLPKGGTYTLIDDSYSGQPEAMKLAIENLKKMGDIKDIVGMLPGAGKMKISEKDIDEKEIARFKAIIQSMTPKERADCRILNYTRKKRIAAGSGTSVQDVNKLVKQFEQTKELMKRFGKSGKKGMKLPF